MQTPKCYTNIILVGAMGEGRMDRNWLFKDLLVGKSGLGALRGEKAPRSVWGTAGRRMTGLADQYVSCIDSVLPRCLVVGNSLGEQKDDT